MFRLIAIGDLHDSTTNLGRLEPIASTADLLVVTGDLTTNGGVPTARPIVNELRRLSPRLLAQMGNMDHHTIDAFLTREGINLHRRGHRLGDVGIFGVGGSNPTPFSTPTEFTEEEIAAFLEEGHAAVADAPVRIAVPHMPPRDTAADRIRSGSHVGSTAVRRFLETAEPHLCLTGHIHESVGSDRIGRTLILNPGPFAEGRYVEVRIDEAAVEAEIRRLI